TAAPPAPPPPLPAPGRRSGCRSRPPRSAGARCGDAGRRAWAWWSREAWLVLLFGEAGDGLRPPLPFSDRDGLFVSPLLASFPLGRFSGQKSRTFFREPDFRGFADFYPQCARKKDCKR